MNECLTENMWIYREKKWIMCALRKRRMMRRW